jgi:hypothetical protein
MGAIFGIFLETIANLFEEISCSVGKRESQAGRSSIFMMGWMQHVLALLILIVVFLLGFDQFRFSWESWPTMAIKLVLDIFQVHIALLAIEATERTAFSFVRMLTLPILLVVDLVLGYVLLPAQLAGMILLAGIFLYTFANHVMKNKGMWLLIFIAVNSAATISIYKYHITNFNSVLAEQMIVYVVLTIYLWLYLKFRTKVKFRSQMLRPAVLVQAFSMGFAALLSSYAFIFAPASVITTARRAGSILWSTLSGLLYFKEDHKKQKLFIAFLLIVVLVLLAI